MENWDYSVVRPKTKKWPARPDYTQEENYYGHRDHNEVRPKTREWSARPNYKYTQENYYWHWDHNAVRPKTREWYPRPNYTQEEKYYGQWDHSEVRPNYTQQGERGYWNVEAQRSRKRRSSRRKKGNVVEVVESCGKIALDSKERNPKENNNTPREYDENNSSVEGIHSNPLFSNILASLVGSFVQLQVKNGDTYNGILRTYSLKMDVVLEMVHKLEKNNNTTPSNDRLIENIIFNKSDVLCIITTDLNLVNDTFTDKAISKCDSKYTEADMKTLQPWDGGEDDEIAGLELENANGWNPSEMFRTNEKKFNVQTNYDDNLTQYSTPLVKRNSKEFKAREEEARKLAREILRDNCLVANIKNAF